MKNFIVTAGWGERDSMEIRIDAVENEEKAMDAAVDILNSDYEEGWHIINVAEV